VQFVVWCYLFYFCVSRTAFSTVAYFPFSYA